MPAPLRFVYSASCVLVALGWLATVALGRSSPVGGQFPWLGVLVLLLPVSAALALGFSEGQSWTRPLMLVLLVLSAAIVTLSDFEVLGASLLGSSLCAAAYLYGSPAVRSYYGYLHETALVRIEKSDLRSALFIPLYTGAVGIAVGAWLGYYLVTRHLGYSSGLGVNDVAGIVCAGVFCASLLGVVGRWIGDALVSRLSRAV